MARPFPLSPHLFKRRLMLAKQQLTTSPSLPFFGSPLHALLEGFAPPITLGRLFDLLCSGQGAGSVVTFTSLNKCRE